MIPDLYINKSVVQHNTDDCSEFLHTLIFER